MNNNTACFAATAFRNQIIVAEATNSYWIEWAARGNRLFSHGLDATGELVAGCRRRGSLARAILDAPPPLLPNSDIDASEDDLD